LVAAFDDVVAEPTVNCSPRQW